MQYAGPQGQVHTVRWADLQLVGVDTNAFGPFVEDVYFYLEGKDGTVSSFLKGRLPKKN